MIQKTLTIFFFLLISAKSLFAQDSEAIADSSLKIMEIDFNFGKIPQGKPVTHYFEIMNTGKDAFKLDNVQASCGCTTPEWDHELVLEPGKSTKIKVGYNAAAEGPFAKTITIIYKQDKSKQITIKGDVWQTPTSSAPSNLAIAELQD